MDTFREMKDLMFMQHLHYKSLVKQNMKYYSVHHDIKNNDDNNNNNNNKKH